MRALVIIDMQNDFMPGGALPVSGADHLIAVINRLIPLFSFVVASCDWHPKDHVSFAVNHPGKQVAERVVINGVEQMLWPVHCVQHTHGAQLVKGMLQEKIGHLFFKGTERSIDSYSAFFDQAQGRATGLKEALQKQGIDELVIVGVATDYCVLSTVLDALELGFKVSVVVDACCGIDLKPGDVKRALSVMAAKGAHLISSSEV